MSLIYEPKGKAGEYSPLAVNIYSGCSHGCFYCYVPNIMKVNNKNYVHSDVSERNGFINKLKSEAKNYKSEKKQVLLSFTTDPYCGINDELNLTRETIKILCENGFPVAVLTKGGNRALKDMDIFIKYKDRIKIGCSLTLFNDESVKKYERGASMYSERENLLKECNKNGIKTWASIEPVIIPEETITILNRTVDFVDQYKIGKLNHFPKLEENINWTEFLYKSLKIMRDNNKMFMIKEDLAKYDIDKKLTKQDLDSKKMFITVKDDSINQMLF